MNDIAQSATESQNKILLIEAGTTLLRSSSGRGMFPRTC